MRGGNGADKNGQHQYIRLHETREDLLSRSEEYNDWSVHVRDATEFQNKVGAIRQDGSENLMIMADYDHTLSTAFMPKSMEELRNQRLLQMGGTNEMNVSASSGQLPALTESVIKMVFHCDRISQDHIDETKRLFEKYYPIEMDPTIDPEVKKGHMKDWFTENLKMYAEL